MAKSKAVRLWAQRGNELTVGLFERFPLQDFFEYSPYSLQLFCYGMFHRIAGIALKIGEVRQIDFTFALVPLEKAKRKSKAKVKPKAPAKRKVVKRGK